MGLTAPVGQQAGLGLGPAAAAAAAQAEPQDAVESKGPETATAVAGGAPTEPGGQHPGSQPDPRPRPQRPSLWGRVRRALLSSRPPSLTLDDLGLGGGGGTATDQGSSEGNGSTVPVQVGVRALGTHTALLPVAPQ